MASVTKEVRQYVEHRKNIGHCLDSGLINYSALARKIQRETGLKAKDSAIIAALRRMKRQPRDNVPEILDLINSGSIHTQNNVEVFTLDRMIYPDALIDFERVAKKGNGIFYAIEGVKTITIITSSQHQKMFLEKFNKYVLLHKTDMCLIMLTCPGINRVRGVVSYITGLFSDAGINIEEFMSCHDDTMIILEAKNLHKGMKLLNS